MTINQLALVLMADQDEASDNTDLVSVIESWISDAIDEISSATDWISLKSIFSLNTVASQATYTLDSSIKDIRSIRFTGTDEEITYVDEPRLFSIASDLEQLAKPRFWFFDSQSTNPADAIPAQPPLKIRFHPIADTVYPLMVSARKHALIAPISGSAVIPFRQEMIPAIKDRVRAYILGNDKDYEGMQVYLQMFYDKVNKLVAKEESKPGANYLVMQPRDVWGADIGKLVQLDPSHFAR